MLDECILHDSKDREEWYGVRPSEVGCADCRIRRGIMGWGNESLIGKWLLLEHFPQADVGGARGIGVAELAATMKNIHLDTAPRRRPRIVALLALASSLTILPSFGQVDNNAIFVAADIDLSGSLSVGEFTTTLTTGIGASAALRKFKAADRNLNGSVQLNEFLIFTGTIPAPRRLMRSWM